MEGRIAMPIVFCHGCGEDEDLSGEKVGGAIKIVCGRCGHSWMRDSEPTCPTCGSGDVRPFTEPLVQRARGTAYSVVGQRTVYLCEACDASEIETREPATDLNVPREDPWR